MQRREHGVGRLSFGPRNSDWSDGLLLDVEPKHVAILGAIFGGTKKTTRSAEVRPKELMSQELRS